MSTVPINLIRLLRAKRKRIFVHIHGNTTMNMDTNQLFFLGRRSSPVIAQHYIDQYCVSLVSSGNVYFTVPPTMITRKKISSYSELPHSNKIKFLMKGNTEMSLRSKQLYIYNGIQTSAVVSQKIIDGYCVSITHSGSVYVTVPPTMINV